ncbi:MAG: HD domain-containing protein, partial [Lachnospiraceae bacterium]|nr:HD domain-containing protein [Lachnospiraceae bacterium]
KEEGIDESVSYNEKAIALREHYTEIKDSKNRMCIFTAYNNMIAPVGQTRMDMKKKMFEYYHAAMDLWNSEEVQKLDGDDEEFKERIEQIQTDVMFCEAFLEEMPEDFQNEFKKLHKEVKAEAEKNGSDDVEGEIFRSDLKLKMIDGGAEEEIMEEAIAYINSIPEPDYEKDEYEALLRLLNYHNSACLAFDILKYYKVPKDREKKYTDRFLKKVTYVHTSIPFNFWPSMMDELCAEWFKESAPFIDDPEEEKNLLLKLIIRRQPLTYIHSIMVSEISKEIAAAIIKGDPDFFVGILDTKNEEEVKEKSEELIRYISDCAILHDSGKCGIVEVINRQNRHLYDEEFSIIKRHPQKGLDLLKHEEGFAPYLDVIIGHHKTYDGKGGYPLNFDNTASPVRSVIDLIAIADSIDAATDILGRNYSEGKDYDTLYSELKAGSGTRYNPDIVDLIGQDKRLYDELMWITGEGRHEVYYTVFDEIIF